MSYKNRFLSITGFAFLLACSFACAQEGSSPDSKKQESSDSQKQKADDQHTALASETSTALDIPTTSEEQEQPLTKDDILKISEAIGNSIGRNLKMPGMSLDIDSIIKGMRAGYNGQPSPLADKDYELLVARLQEQVYKQLTEQNLKAANDFLTKNATEAGVVVIEPGKLQYRILQEGKGEAVQEHFSPQIQYTGKFLDGTTFGSSTETGGPITVPLDQTIPGFSKGILGMKEGEKRMLWVHPDIGYGTSGHLPPNSLLIFEIELIKANAPEAVSDTADEDLSDLALSDDDESNDEEDEDHNAASEANKEHPAKPAQPAPAQPAAPTTPAPTTTPAPVK